jgi:hypothetical protein
MSPEAAIFLNRVFGATIASSDDDIAARIEAGRAAWAALHTERNPTRDWFETEWKPLIPQGCGCAGSANELLEQNPPRYDSPEDWFAWTVQYHNLVNVKLGKPTLTLDEARAIWRSNP